jgi:hypothetical protein
VNSEVKVGILFFLGLGLLLWFTIFTTQIGQTKGAYAVRFPRVTRLKEGDGVTYNGVRVGTVTEVAPVLRANDGKPAVQGVLLDQRRPPQGGADRRAERVPHRPGAARRVVARDRLASGVPITPDAGQPAMSARSRPASTRCSPSCRGDRREPPGAQGRHRLGEGQPRPLRQGLDPDRGAWSRRTAPRSPRRSPTSAPCRSASAI